MADFTATTGNDNFVGTDGETDVFQFKPQLLTRNDTVMGDGGDGDPPDRLALLNAGSLDFQKANHTLGIEEIYLAGRGFNFVRLTGDFVHSASNHTVEIFG